jgi:DNA-binding response OmpR family regulator
MTKVLVIEDDEVLRESILDILGTRNFDVIGAEDGIEDYS